MQCRKDQNTSHRSVKDYCTRLERPNHVKHSENRLYSLNQTLLVPNEVNELNIRLVVQGHCGKVDY